jgi:hypothetical protein
MLAYSQHKFITGATLLQLVVYHREASCSNISTIWDQFLRNPLKYNTIQSTWPGNKYSMSRVDPSRNL